jgi:hypothetical protein
MSITHSLEFNGEFLERGFWLYVWDVTTPAKKHLYYVGRTGDSSSNNAQSPFNRMGQYLGFNKNSNVLRRHLESRDITVEKCKFHLVAYGPILKEATTQDEHISARDMTAAIEKKLADALKESDYEVLNRMNCRKKLDVNLWAKVREAFAVNFPRITRI